MHPESRGTVLARVQAGVRCRGYDLLSWLGLALLFASLFRYHLLGIATFMGTSDRLNASITMRLYHVSSLQQHGRIPAWNDAMLLGFPVDGLGYMPILNDPLAYVLAWFPASQLVHVYGHVTLAVFLLAAWSAYLYVKDAVGSALAAFLGSCVYALASYSLLKIGQQDPITTTFVQMPLGLLVLRRSTRHPFVLMLLGFTAIVASLLLWTFVQEAAYVVILFGAYALYRSLVLRSVRPLLICALGGLIAVPLALPRLLRFYQESQQLNRSRSFIVTDWSEGLRWFHEHIYAPNSHEGFQLFTSTFVAMIVLTTLVLPRFWTRNLARDVPFHLAFLILVFLVVLVMPVRYLVYLLFMQSDLLHSRFSLVGLMPLAVITAAFVDELRSSVPTGPRRLGSALGIVAACLTAVAALWLLDRMAESTLSLRLHLDEIPRLWGNPTLTMNPGIVLKVLGAMLLFIVGAAAWVACARWSAGRERTRQSPTGAPAGSDHARRFLAYGLCALIVAQMVEFADFQLSGPHTWTFPDPYRDNGPYTAPATAFRVPSQATMQAIRARLETDAYRSVAIHDANRFPGPLEFASYLSEFWQLRLIQGYGTITARFGSLPWPGNMANLRSLYFPAGSPLPWDLLALLNVKYAVTVNPALYYNLAGGDPTQAAEATLADLQISENPLPVAPRQFFVRSVRPQGTPQETPLLPRDPTRESLVDGITAPARYRTDGRLDVQYDGDRIDVSVDRGTRPRFLVLNEMFHPGWQAFADGHELPIHATNIVMRGMLIPPGITEVHLRFMPPGLLDLLRLSDR